MIFVKSSWLVVCLSVCIVTVTSNVVFQQRQEGVKPVTNDGHGDSDDAVRVFARENLSSLKSNDDPPQDSNQYGLSGNDSLINLGNLDWDSIIRSLVNKFRPNSHALRNGYQFGILYMGYFDEANPKANHICLKPLNAQGHPVIDDNVPLSPRDSSEYVNYVYSRPTIVNQDPRKMSHAEKMLIGERKSLQQAYRKTFNCNANTIILYSYIMPCDGCTSQIIREFNDIKTNFRYRVVGYTNEGLYLPYMTEKKNKDNRNNLKDNDIMVFQVNLATKVTDTFTPDADVHEIGKETGNKRQENMEHGFSYQDTYISPLHETFQGCMMNCLESDQCCSCTEDGKKSMTAALVNELTSACALSDINSCADKWVRMTLTSDIRGWANNCTDPDIVASNINVCASKCYGRPFSKPLNLKDPDIYTGLLTDFTDLSDLPDVDLTEFCEDMRAEGLLCTMWRSDSFTAGNTHCRPQNRCGYHGYTYSWCYVDWSNHWDYCCTGSCGFGQETDYMMCQSGNKWQYCFT